MNKLAGLCAALAAFGLVACGGAQDEQSGGVAMDIMAAETAPITVISAALTQTADVKLVVKGPHDFIKTHTFDSLPAHFSFSPAPVGNYTYVATAKIGSATFESTGGFAIKGGEVTYLSTIMMQQTNPTVSMDVKAPFIEKVEISGLNSHGSGAWGEPLLLLAKIYWPDNDKPDMDNLRVTWTNECIGGATKAAGMFVDPLKKYYVDEFNIGVIPYAESWAVFESYCQGAERVTITAANFNNPSCSGEGCEIISSVSFTIPYNEQGYGASVIDFNYDPNVYCDRVENAEPLPNAPVLLDALASDVDSPESGWTYKWSSNCGGSFEDATALDTTFYAPGIYGKACKLTVEVWDGEGGYNKGYVSVKTAPANFGLTVDPYIDVCDSTTWICGPVETHAYASSAIVGGKLVMNKAAADGGGVAFGPNAHIVGVAGMVFAEASFDVTGNGIGAGTPRFNLRFADGTSCALDGPAMAGSRWTFKPESDCAATGQLVGLDIIADMGGLAGAVEVSNVVVNGVPVSM